jgi:hypothetical protein
MDIRKRVQGYGYKIQIQGIGYKESDNRNPISDIVFHKTGLEINGTERNPSSKKKKKKKFWEISD